MSLQLRRGSLFIIRRVLLASVNVSSLPVAKCVLEPAGSGDDIGTIALFIDSEVTGRIGLHQPA